MAIGFVRAAHASSLAASSTLAVSVTVGTGNCVVVIVDFDDGTVTPNSVTDDGSNVYTLRANANNNHNISIWSTAATGTTAATTVTINLPTSTAIARIAIVAVYSGVGGIGNTATTTGTSNTPTINLTTQDANNFVVAGFMQLGNSNTWTAGTGNLRDSDVPGSGFASDALNDNTAATASVVTNAVNTVPNGNYAAVALELRSPTTTTVFEDDSYNTNLIQYIEPVISVW